MNAVHRLSGPALALLALLPLLGVEQARGEWVLESGASWLVDRSFSGATGQSKTFSVIWETGYIHDLNQNTGLGLTVSSENAVGFLALTPRVKWWLGSRWRLDGAFGPIVHDLERNYRRFGWTSSLAISPSSWYAVRVDVVSRDRTTGDDPFVYDRETRLQSGVILRGKPAAGAILLEVLGLAVLAGAVSQMAVGGLGF